MGFGICSAPSIIKMTFSRYIRFAVLAEIHIQIPIAVVTESSNALLYSAPSAI